MITGRTVVLLEKQQTGVDAFNRPTYAEVPVEVENVLIAPLSDQEVLDTLNLTGRKAVYQLGIPKGDAHDWENQLDRIEKVVKKFDKPFFFAECGCMSVKNANLVPNDWSVRGDIDQQGQADWYKAMFDACDKREWAKGFCIWDWTWRQYPIEKAQTHGGYDIYGKLAQQVVREYYGSK